MLDDRVITRAWHFNGRNLDNVAIDQLVGSDVRVPPRFAAYSSYLPNAEAWYRSYATSSLPSIAKRISMQGTKSTDTCEIGCVEVLLEGH
jgi:hypothetical protein